MADSSDGAAEVLAKIATWDEPFDELGKRLHQVITEAAPHLKPRLWYGMPGYARTKSSPVLCFFSAETHLSFGLTEKANLVLPDDAPDQLIDSAWFVNGLDHATEARIAAIVRTATS